jgi:MFS family permease
MDPSHDEAPIDTPLLVLSADNAGKAAAAASGPPSKATLPVRWAMLGLVSFALLGDFYAYDQPSALNSQLGDHFSASMDDATFQTNFALLYSVYSFPNIVLPFFGGVLVDRYGCRRTLLWFSVILVAGQALVAFGVSISSFWVMLLGRLLYSLGGESITVAQSAFLTEWFKGSELALSFGISLSVSRGGSVLNNYMSPLMAQQGGLAWSFWCGAMTCAFSLCCVLVLIPMDLKAERTLRRMAAAVDKAGGRAPGNVSTRAPPGGGGADGGSRGSLGGGNGGDGGGGGGVGGGDGGDDGKAAAVEAGDSAPADAPADAAGGSVGGGGVWADLLEARKFGRMFWLVCLNAVACYGVVMPWNNTASAALLERSFFKPPQNLSDCCCWAPGQCFERWPDPGSAHASGGAWRFVNATQACRRGCAFDAATAPPINVSADQLAHMDCLASAGSQYSLVDAARAPRVDGYDVPGFWPHNVTAGMAQGPDGGVAWLDAYCDLYNTAVLAAAIAMSIPYYINVASSAALGFLVDKYGQCATVCCVAPLAMAVAHLLLGYTTDVDCYAPLALQGVAYSCYAAALWPPVVYIVESHQVGTAYGLMTAMMNFGFSAIPLVAAAIYNASGQRYIPNVEYFYVGLAMVGALLGAWMVVEDRKLGSPFNKPHLQDANAGNKGGDGGSSAEEEDN